MNEVKQDNEFIKIIDKSIERYESLKISYTNQMTGIQNKINHLIKQEGYVYSNERIVRLLTAYDNNAEGLLGVCEYLKALYERKEAIKNDPDNVDNCKYTI